MFHFSKKPLSLVDIYSTLCLSQVKDQLLENLVYITPNPPSFVYNGHLFVYTTNKAIMESEPHPEMGLAIAQHCVHN